MHWPQKNDNVIAREKKVYRFIGLICVRYTFRAKFSLKKIQNTFYLLIPDLIFAPLPEKKKYSLRYSWEKNLPALFKTDIPRYNPIGSGWEIFKFTEGKLQQVVYYKDFFRGKSVLKVPCVDDINMTPMFIKLVNYLKF